MELNKYIEHTNLDSKATLKDIEKLCNEAITYNFSVVCVYPYYTHLAKELLKDTNIEVCTVIGTTCSTRESKVYEAIDAVSKGSDQIEMVVNIAALKNKDYEYIKDEIEEIRDSIDGKVLKISVDTSLLTDKEFVKMVEICNDTYVNYIEIKIDSYEEVTFDKVDIINKHKSGLLEIKVSGKIKNEEFAYELIESGVSKIGFSDSVKIMEKIKGVI